jgi:SAM-dependent methyltransferase
MDAVQVRPPEEPEPSASRYTLALDEHEISRYRLMAERARSAEADLWLRAGIVAGARVADIGCGPGALLLSLAGAVAPGGVVSAVDADPDAVAAASALVASAGLTGVRVERARADRTGLDAEAYDVVMMRHVLAHNGGAEDAIIAHLASRLRPGGCLYLVDGCGTATRTIGVDDDLHALQALEDLHNRYQALLRHRGNDVEAGLRLGERLTRAGLELVDFSGSYLIQEMPPGVRPPSWAARTAMVTAGLATRDDVERWGAALDRLDAAAGRPTVFVPMFVAVGRRPA